MAVLVTNNASTTLASTVSAVAGTVTVATGQGVQFPAPTGANYFYATMVNGSNAYEIVKCTSRTGDTLTVTRAQDGTSALTFNIGDKIEARPVAAIISDLQTNALDGSRLTAGTVSPTALSSAPALGVNAVTTPNITDANVTAAKLAAGAAASNLGFTPVQQGGGTSQGANKIYLGWATNKVTVQVDATAPATVMTEQNDGTVKTGGYRGVPSVALTSNYTPAFTDMGGQLYHTDGVVYTLTVPSDTTLATTVGSTFLVINGSGAANVSIVQDTGVTLVWGGAATTGTRTLAATGMATLLKVAANTWFISGVGLS